MKKYTLFLLFICLIFISCATLPKPIKSITAIDIKAGDIILLPYHGKPKLIDRPTEQINKPPLVFSYTIWYSINRPYPIYFQTWVRGIWQMGNFIFEVD